MLRSDALATQRTQRLNGGPSQVSLPFFRGAPPWLRRTSRSVAVPERKRWDAGRRLGYAREEGVRHILCVWPAQASEAAYTYVCIGCFPLPFAGMGSWFRRGAAE